MNAGDRDRFEHLVREAARVFGENPNLRIDRSVEDARTLRIELYRTLRHYTVYPEGQVLEVMQAAANRVSFPLPAAAASEIARQVWADMRWDTGIGPRQSVSAYYERLDGERAAPPTPYRDPPAAPPSAPTVEPTPGDGDPQTLLDVLTMIGGCIAVSPGLDNTGRRVAFEVMGQLARATIDVIGALSQRQDLADAKLQSFASSDAERARLAAVLDLTQRIEKLEAAVQLITPAPKPAGDGDLKANIVLTTGAPSSLIALHDEIQATHDRWTTDAGFARGFRPGAGTASTALGKDLEMSRLLAEVVKAAIGELGALQAGIAGLRSVQVEAGRHIEQVATRLGRSLEMNRHNFGSTQAGLDAIVAAQTSMDPDDRDALEATRDGLSGGGYRTLRRRGGIDISVQDAASMPQNRLSVDRDGWAQSVLANMKLTRDLGSISGASAFGKYVLVVDGSEGPTSLDDVIKCHVLTTNVGLREGDVILFERRSAIVVGYQTATPLRDVLAIHIDHIVAKLDRRLP